MVQELNIVKPSYDKDKLFEIFKRLVNFKCDWVNKKDCMIKVEDAILNGILVSPLGIRDLVYSAIRIKSCSELELLISRRAIENVRIYAKDIEGCKIPTKVFLIITYLLEYRNINILQNVFDNVLTNLVALTEKNTLSLSFRQIMRDQSGFRIEKITNISKGIRFSHPNYEEALAQLLSSNRQFKYIAEKVVESLLIKDFTTLLNCVQRLVVKRTDIAENLFNQIIDYTLFSSISFRNKIILSNYLVRAFNKTYSTFYIEALKKLYPTKTDLNFIFATKNPSKLFHGLQFYYNYLFFVPSINIKDNEIEVHLDSIINTLHNSNNTTYTIGNLEWLNKFNQDYVSYILDSKVGKKIISELYKIDNLDRLKLKALFKNSKSSAQYNKRHKRIKFKPKKERRSINKSYFEDAYIVVDDGAQKALEKGFNLLPPGVLQSFGNFYSGDRIIIKDKNQVTIASGITQYNSEEVESIRGSHSSSIFDILGYSKASNIIASNKIIMGDDDVQQQI